MHVYDIQGMTKAKLLVQICPYCLKCIKFGKLFLRKVRKIVATRCLDFSSKCSKMRLAAGLRPDPLGELKRSPDPLAAKRGPTSKGGGKGGREGREGGGRGQSPPLQPITTLTTADHIQEAKTYTVGVTTLLLNV